MITPHDILSSSDTYPTRLDDPECTPEVRINAADLAERVSKLLERLGFTAADKITVSSGFRPSNVNRLIGNAAKKSAHMTGEACDLRDTKGEIACRIANDLSLLGDCDLYMEDPKHTLGWVHLSIRAPKSGKRVFIP